MAAISTINILFKADMRQFSTELQNSVREAKKLGDNLKSAGRGMSLYVTAPIVAAGAASVVMASDFEESNNKVQVAFKQSSAVVQGFAKSALTSFGIAEGSALDMAALFGDMATSMGLPEAQAAKMSTALVGLAGDLASFKNIGIAQATTALNGVFTGETESLKTLGVVMTEAALSAFAVSQGITKNIKDFTQAEKVQLRYNFVMNATKNAQGDFARTGAGAANQNRVFAEGLKQIAVQFGQVILPYYTAFITKVNGVITAVGQMSPAVRTGIVVFAALAASVGPVLLGLGAVVSLYPAVVTGFAAIKTASNALTASLAANPLTALLVAMGAIVTLTLVATSRFNSLTDASEEFNNTIARGAGNIAKEKAALEQNLSIARDKNETDKRRKEAIEAINAASPELLGNLTLETINTNEAREAVEKYNVALLKRAQVTAAQEKLVDVEKRLLDLQMANLEAVRPSVWQALGNAVVAGGDSYRFASAQLETINKNFKEENVNLTALREKLLGFIKDNGKYAEALGEVNAAQESMAKSGTIAYYENQIAGLKKLQNEVATTAGAFTAYQERIDALQKKIDALQGKRVTVESVEVAAGNITTGTGESEAVQNMRANLAMFEKVQAKYEEGTARFIQLQEIIDGLKFNIKVETEGLASATEDIQMLPLIVGDATEAAAERLQGLQNMAVAVSDGFASAFESMGGRFVDSLDLANDGLQGFFKELSSVIIKIISAMLAQSMAQSIAGATAAGAATGPASIFTTPAFIAQAVGGVLAAFAALPKFEKGGTVGGNSYWGDKLMVRVNSGETILNRKQQERLYNMIQPANVVGGGPIEIIGKTRISGSDLDIVFERYLKTKSRNR